MLDIETGSFRRSTSWLRQRLSKRNISELKASGAIDDELWILLEYYSEVESVGIKFLQDNGVNKRSSKKIFKYFQAYVRQAKNYYYSAKVLHPRSAGLLYYYCFLNLAKAGLVIKKPQIGGKKISHGLSCLPRDFSKLKKQTIKVLNDDGVFPTFYEWYFGIKIKAQYLGIQALFNYCTDISYQCLLAGFGSSKVLPAYYVHILDKDNKTGWPLIGIAGFDLCKRYKKSFRNFSKNFEKVELPEFSGREYFKVSNYELSAFTFFQSKQVSKWPGDNLIPDLESRDFVINSFNSLLKSNYFELDFDYHISLPYLENNQIPMDETIAIYMIMYYISNLVRYNPSYLEELLSKKEAWLIESFIRSCSLTFLRSMISRIVNIDYVLSSR